MTQTAAVVGTAQYLSPEQARGEPVDSRSDVYSAGCLLYELLTGRPPFIGDSPVAVAYQHVREPAMPPSDHDDELPAEIDAIVMKSLAKRVEDRYQSAAAMRNDIERYLGGHPVHVAPPPPMVESPLTSTAQTAVVSPVPPPVVYDEDDDRSNRPGLLIFLALLLVLVLGLAAYFLPKMFESPSNQVEVPKLIGLSQQKARTAIGDAGLSVGNVDYVTDASVPKNRVVKQNPGVSELVDPGSAVDFTVSSGKPTTTVPYLIGQTQQEAAAALSQQHLKGVFKKAKSDLPQGTVINTDPPANTNVPEGSSVTVSISRGPHKVPDVVGMQQDKAEQTLRDAGYVPVPVSQPSSSAPAGQVIQQVPPAGQPQPQGAQVTIVVSSGPTESTSPPTTPPTTPPTSEPTSPITSISAKPRPGGGPE
jgi:beta-lactam-binding protein with PASTA domain